MKKSLIVFILTLSLFVGILSAPAMAYSKSDCNLDFNNLKNSISTAKGGYRIITVSREDISGILSRVNNWYSDLLNRINGQVSEQPAPAPEENPEEAVPQPVPEEEPKMDEPAPTPEEKPEQPAPTPEEKPEQPVPAPEEKPEQPAPAPEEKPEQPAPAPEEKPEQPSSQIGSQQAQMLNLVNQERTKAGLKPLVWDASLADVAQVKAKDMVDNNYFDHNSPTYGSPFNMMKNFGISYRAAGENLAGSSSVERAHTGLMNSEGHRKNILNSNFTHIGIGVEKSPRYGYVYVQMFIGK